MVNCGGVAGTICGVSIMPAMGDSAVVVTPHCSATTAPQSLLPSLASLASVADAVLHDVTSRAAQQQGVRASVAFARRFRRVDLSLEFTPPLALLPCSAS